MNPGQTDDPSNATIGKTIAAYDYSKFSNDTAGEDMPPPTKEEILAQQQLDPVFAEVCPFSYLMRHCPLRRLGGCPLKQAKV